MKRQTLFHLLRNISLAVLLSLGSVASSFAVPAYPYPIKHVLPDGSTLTIQMHGDEYFGYTTTMQGYPVTMGDDGFYYYTSYTNESTTRSAVRASDIPTKAAIPVGMMSQATINYRRANSPFKKNSTWMDASLTKSSAQKADKSNMPSFYLTNPLVILVEYSDIKFVNSGIVSKIENNYNGDHAAPNGSMKTYYTDNSMGQYIPTCSVHGVVTAKYKSEYYAGEDGTENAYKLVIEACKAVDNEVDFNDYDQNNDGLVDNIIVLFAGYNNAEGADKTIWPHRWDVRGAQTVKLDGVTLSSYAILSECKGNAGGQLAGVGTTIHEFGHVLGLMDIYDTDYGENGTAVGFGSNSLMGSGNYNNSGNTPPYLNMMEREMLGWASYTPMPTSGSVTLENIGASNKGYIMETQNPDEYYIVEMRDSKSGWDKYIDMGNHLSSGMMVYHVDKSQNTFADMTAIEHWAQNTPNAYSYHECMRLISSTTPVDFNDMESYVFPGKNDKTTLDGSTTPMPLKDWASNKLPFSLVNIEVDGNASSVSFDVNGEDQNKKFSVEGRVLTLDGQPLSGVTVKLIAKDPSSTSPQLSVVSLEPTLTKASNEYYAQTNSAGYFTITDVPANQYTLAVNQYGYVPHTATVDITKDEDLGEIKLIEGTGDDGIQTKISHASTICAGYLQGETTGLRVSWTPEMLEEEGLVGVDINNIYWLSGVQGVKASAKLIVDDVVVFSTQLTTISGYNIIPIETPVTIEEGNTITIEYTYSKTSGLIVGIDGGPAVAGYGGMVAVSSGDWLSIKDDASIDANIFCGFSIDKADSNLAQPEVKLTALGQYYFSIKWDSSDLGVSAWRVDVHKGSSTQSYNTKELEFSISGTTPGTSYQVSVTPIIGTQEGDASTITVSTPALTAPYAAMTLKDLGDGAYYISHTNAPQCPSSVDISVDGALQPLIGNNIAQVQLEEGTHTIVMTISYANGSSETITRKITI